MLHVKVCFYWPSGVSKKEIFEYFCNVQVYFLGVGAELPLESKRFRIINNQSIFPFPAGTCNHIQMAF